MLRITTEIVPFGIEERAYDIGTIAVFNKGWAGEEDKHVYGVIDLGDSPGMYVEEVTHSRADGAYVLVEKVLRMINSGREA